MIERITLTDDVPSAYAAMTCPPNHTYTVSRGRHVTRIYDGNKKLHTLIVDHTKADIRLLSGLIAKTSEDRSLHVKASELWINTARSRCLRSPSDDLKGFIPPADWEPAHVDQLLDPPRDP